MNGRRLLIAALIAAVAAVLAVIAFGFRDQGLVADERNGVLRGIRLGTSAAQVRARLGDPTDDEPGFFPPGVAYSGPPSISDPWRPQRPKRPPPGPSDVHYGDEAYLITTRSGVIAMATVAGDARTRAGVGIGDDLALVRERYDRVMCGEDVLGENHFSGRTAMYAWCYAVLGDIRVWFGGDPIQSLTLNWRQSPTHR